MYITIIEDKKKISNNLSKNLKKNWFNTNVIGNYEMFINNNSYLSDLYIINISLEDKSTQKIIHYLRDLKNNTTPIIILSEIKDLKEAIHCLNI